MPHIEYGNVDGFCRVTNLQDVSLVQLTGEAVELYGIAFGASDTEETRTAKVQVQALIFAARDRALVDCRKCPERFDACSNPTGCPHCGNQDVVLLHE